MQIWRDRHCFLEGKRKEKKELFVFHHIQATTHA